MTPGSSYLAVDGGGTKTVAVLVDEQGQVLSRGHAGTSNYSQMGSVKWIAVISSAIEDAKRACGPDTKIARAWIGSAGIESETQAREAQSEASKLLKLNGDSLRVTNDATLLSASLQDAGIVVIAGTGSAVHGYTKTPQGLQYTGRAGGLGWILGDEGSGFGIGRAALRAVLSEDRVSQLCEAILAHWSLDSKEALLNSVYAKDLRPQRIASLTPLIFARAFDEHDPQALHIVQGQAAELADQIAQVAARISPPCGLSFGGSVALHPAYRSLIHDALAQKAPTFSQVRVVADAAATAAQSLVRQA